MERFDKLGLMYRCEYCLAGKGVWCRTLTGAKATALHNNRTDPVRLAFYEGYEEALGINRPAGLITYSGNKPEGTSYGVAG